MEVRLKLKCGSQELCSELADFIVKRRGVRSARVLYEIRGGLLEISVVGSPYDVLSTRRAIMKSYAEWRGLVEFKLGRSKAINLNILASNVGKPFMTDVLALLLRERGYKAELRGDVLESDAPAETVILTAREVAEKLEEVSRSYPRASRNLKALLVALLTLGYDVESSLEALRRMGFVEENGRLRLTAEWSSLLAKLRSTELGAEGSEARGEKGGGQRADNQSVRGDPHTREPDR